MLRRFVSPPLPIGLSIHSKKCTEHLVCVKHRARHQRELEKVLASPGVPNELYCCVP